MSKIKDLYDEIEDLNKKIEDESFNHQKRKYLIDNQIEHLEEEKKRAGFNKDPLSVQKFNSQMLQLKEDRNRDYLEEFKLQIKECQKQISDIIFDYYKNGTLIDEIFEIEDVSKSIQNELMDLSNFGKNTGYLFVDELRGEQNNWIYFNPIRDIKITEDTLKDLKYSIIKSGDSFLGFDSLLIEKTDKKDLIICQKLISEKINNLHDEYYVKTDETITFLKKYADKFTKPQIIGLNEFIKKHLKYYADFSYILDYNEEKFDESFYEEIYTGIIDSGIRQLDDATSFELMTIFDCFDEFSYNFSKNQIIQVYNFFRRYYVSHVYYNTFNEILEVNQDKFSEECLDEIYTGLFDEGIEDLKKSDLDSDTIFDIFSYFKIFMDKFTKEQLNLLCHIVLNNFNLYNFVEPFRDIVDFTMEKFNSSLSEKLYNDIITKRIEALKEIDNFSNISKKILNVLKDLDDKLEPNHLIDLCRVISNNPYIVGFSEDFEEILEDSCERLDRTVKYDVIYKRIIISRLDFLNVNDAGYVSRDLFKDLSYYSKYFANHVNRFCKIVVNNGYIDYYADDILDILSVNKKLLNEKNINLISKLRIDHKLDELENLTFGYTDAKNILGYLEDYSDEFTKKQITRLCHIVINNDQVYDCWICTDNLRNIISKNSYQIDSQLYEEVVQKNGL